MYLLAVIANEINDSLTDSNHTDIFKYENKLYIKWIDINIQQLILDVKKVHNFYIVVNDKQLELHFNPAVDEKPVNRNVSRKRLCEQFLQKENGDMLYEPNLIELPPSEESEENHFHDLELDLLNLYDDLKEVHRNDIISAEVPENLQHSCLNPVLRQYQIQGIRWMLNRELKPDFLPNEFVIVKTIPEYYSNASDCKIFYYNERTLELIDYKPNEIKIPSGGILADEMGLGKTVEMLGLILLNTKKKRKFCEILDDDEIPNTIPETICNQLQNVMCICNNSNRVMVKHLICCTKCFKYQHRKCVLTFVKISNRIDDRYICPSCWRNHELIESGATIIVSPVVIKLQWFNEISKHIRSEHLKVFIYNGVSETGWINPVDLAKFDVILTDYNVLKSEIYFSNSENRSGLRYEKKFLNPVSPLPLINWWRVCLDESQVVETPTNSCSKMVKTLTTTHRWAVTGTPVEKKIDNLYGLLYFLDCYPYTDFAKWSELSRDFQNGNSKPLTNVLSKIMWRTRKTDVIDQINIPPQTVIVHDVAMSDVESFFYKSQHLNYWKIFRNKAMKIKNDLAISKLDRHTFKLLMEPLRKIRQDCTIPSIFQKNTSNSTIKKFLKPNELLAVLIMNNETDCKSELRSIVSCLNGLAGIHIMRSEYDAAAKLYKNVIRRAAEQDSSNSNITVDTLQQIHAVYNLIDIADNLVSENLNELHDKLSKLETKYINSYYTLVKQCEDQIETTKNSFEESIGKIAKNWKKGNWISDLINEIDEDYEISVLNRIQLELEPYAVLNDISTFHGVQYVLLVWWEELLKSRDELILRFKYLNYFIKNINEKKVSQENSVKIEKLIKSAFECHLKTVTKRVEIKPKSKRCEICDLKTKLLKYECCVFDKHSIKNSDENVGTWNPTFQEYAVKTILNCLQNKKPHDILKNYENYMEMIDLFKKEFKEYSKLWVEVNYTVSAFDELNMCKTRLQAMDPFQMNKEDQKSKYIISIYEMDDEFTEFIDQLNHSEVNFLKCVGRIKYLKYLEEKTEPEVCPICTKKPENKYVALQCGHIMCEVCLTQMKMYQNKFLICCICRNKQSYNEVFSITCKPESNDTAYTYTGDYSTKIETIVRKVLQLRAEDTTVKIIIFSQWTAILSVISKALGENNITHRLKSSKIQTCLNDFKTPNKMITCLLLPLQFGSKGLNLIEATHVFLVEPILNPGEELQAVGRIHRIGQTQHTYVHKFIVRSTVEETIHKTISNDKTGKWRKKCFTIENLQNLFQLE